MNNNTTVLWTLLFVMGKNLRIFVKIRKHLGLSEQNGIFDSVRLDRDHSNKK
jgi:hypothetical protein